MRVGGGTQNPTMNKGFLTSICSFTDPRQKNTSKYNMVSFMSKAYVLGVYSVYFPIYLFVFHREIYAVLSMKSFMTST